MGTDTLRSLEKAVLQLPSRERLSALSDLATIESEIETLSRPAQRADKQKSDNRGAITTTIPLAAEYFGVSRAAIRDWIADGVLESNQKCIGAKIYVIIPPNLILTKKQMENEK